MSTTKTSVSCYDIQGARSGGSGGSNGQPERRAAERFQDGQHVAIFNPWRRLICDLVDLSEKGAKLRIVEGAVPCENEPLALALFDGTLVPALVSWVNPKFVGLKFMKPLTNIEYHLEQIEGDYFKKAVRLQKRVAKPL